VLKTEDSISKCQKMADMKVETNANGSSSAERGCDVCLTRYLTILRM
jgi:hypothetical protein